jgi:hypothetical protein
MPVNKRAARPTAATAPDPRDPQSSEDDFTVLFDRKRTDQFVRTFAQARQVERPRPAPKPPLADRPRSNAPSRAAPARDEEASAMEGTNSSAPPGVVVPSREPIKIVAIPPRLRARVLQVATFLVLGGILGIGVESVARHPAPRAAADPVPLIETEAPPPPVASALAAAGPESPTGASITVSTDKVVVVPPAHHHHHHHAVPGASALAASPGSPALADGTVSAGAVSPDAGVEADDDVSAAIQTLTKAKGEVTLP